jgi:hypothetical protein
LVSTSLIGLVKECCVYPGLLSSQFDHKPVHLQSNRNVKVSDKGLKNWYLEDDLVKMSTEISAL